MTETLNALAALVGQILADRWHRRCQQSRTCVAEVYCKREDDSITTHAPQSTDSETPPTPVRRRTTQAGP